MTSSPRAYLPSLPPSLIHSSASVHCIYVTYKQRKKRRRSVDRSKLLDAEERASPTDDLELNATLPPSPSYINEGFKADDDSLSSHDSKLELQGREKTSDKPEEAGKNSKVEEVDDSKVVSVLRAELH